MEPEFFRGKQTGAWLFQRSPWSRHSYAQERMQELQSNGMQYDEARRTVAQEVGHFDKKTAIRNEPFSCQNGRLPGQPSFCFIVSHAAALQFLHSLLGITVPETMGAIGKTKFPFACRGKTLAPGPSHRQYHNAGYSALLYLLPGVVR